MHHISMPPAGITSMLGNLLNAALTILFAKIMHFSVKMMRIAAVIRMKMYV